MGESSLEKPAPITATILSDPEDTFYGDRRYGAADVEGHPWYVAEKIRPMAPEDWRPSPRRSEGARLRRLALVPRS